MKLRQGGLLRPALFLLGQHRLICEQRWSALPLKLGAKTIKTEPSVLYSALTCRCPRCGEGALFHQLLNLRPACRHCELDYTFIDTGDGPAVFVIFLLGALMMGGALFVEFTFSPATWVHVVLWGLLTPILAIVLLRFMKALLIALQYKHKAEEGRLEDGE